MIHVGYSCSFLMIRDLKGATKMLPMGNHQLEGFAQIRVIGVGGGGSNAVNRMIQANMTGIEFIAMNTDAQALLLTEAPHRIRIGDKLTRGLGAGGNPSVGTRPQRRMLKKFMRPLKALIWSLLPLVWVVALALGLAPLWRRLPAMLGALTVGVVTRPFTFEGKKRQLCC